MRKSGKSILFFDWKNIDIYFEWHTLKTNCIRFLIIFYWRKKFCVHFEEYIFFLRVFFHFFTFFSLRFISTQSDFGANKRAFKYCTSHNASSTPIEPILIPKWVQKTTKERQDLHIPKYHHFHPSFLALFLYFFRISRRKCIF